MKNESLSGRIFFTVILIWSIIVGIPSAWGDTPATYTALPVVGATSEPPLVMLVMGRNHKLFYEAYNDASDLDEDGDLDVGYDPTIDYYGYFDSNKVYTYSSSNGRFEPLRETDDKKVNPDASDEWSGDYLNYLTMCRMDAIRKVLYGGYRSTDTATETVLERAYVPRDAHTWGKEYQSVARDGYDIRYYTPLDLPDDSTYHLFASTSLYDSADSNYRPLLRVLPNNPNRIWNWVSIESTKGIAGTLLETSGTTVTTCAASDSEFDTLVAAWAKDGYQQATQEATEINGCGHINDPGGSSYDYYLTIFSGKIRIETAGTYEFGVDGDDAVEFLLKTDDSLTDFDFESGYYGAHGAAGSAQGTNSVYLSEGTYEIEFRHQEKGGTDCYYLYWKAPGSSAFEKVPESAFTDSDGNALLTQTNYTLESGGSKITDYVVRVQVGVDSMPEDSCKQYTSETTGATVYKPVGLLQRFGESQQMYFGLLTGSYAKNMSGGVLRKNIGDIQDEIDPDTGVFTSVNGIIGNINRIRAVGLGYSGTSKATDYESGSDAYCNCGWLLTGAFTEGHCQMWGNPIAEMMYETLRYFSGAKSPTSAYTFNSTDYTAYYENKLGLATPAWDDPYENYAWCSKPIMLVISDINPTYDSDQLPGSKFATFSGDDLGGMDVGALADTIGEEEGMEGDHYIGAKGTNEDGVCTSKDVDDLGNIRGLCPEEPTKEGSYYSASVAYYGHVQDISTVEGDQNVTTYAVGLASPLPKIEITVGKGVVTLVPFAKSVAKNGSNGTLKKDEGKFQPTNTIVDFYVDTIGETYGKFRINFEDVEQGADHDMDAIIVYEYQVVDGDKTAVDDPAAGEAVKITLTSEYAAGGITQHCGYIISGTTQDGTYLEVRDQPDSGETDVDYYLDTPNGALPGGVWEDGVALPLTAARYFKPIGSGTTTASLLENPLWYAGKWGGFDNDSGDNYPDKVNADLDGDGTKESYDPDGDLEADAMDWDSNLDGIPDTYFYVTNPLRLEEQLTTAFAMIAANTASGTSASVVASTVEGDATLYQAYFQPLMNTQDGEELTWVGYLQALWLDSENNIREDTSQDGKLDISQDRVITFSYENGKTLVNVFKVSHTAPYPDTDGTPDVTLSLDEVSPIWAAGSLLADTDPDDRNILTYPTGGGSDLVAFASPDDSATLSYYSSDFDALKYYLGVGDVDITAFSDANIELLGTDLETRAKKLISYIRGNEFSNLRARTMNGKVWKLGDIVYSTPVAVSGAVESYNSVYSDESYGTYVSNQKDRQTMVYVGANDGMLHAFTGGEYNDDDMQFNASTEKMANGQGDAIGEEMWAYIPRSVLPHLKWLADPYYDHTYYVDLTPKIFDAKIAGTNQDEWGTFLLLGLNMGGKDIAVDLTGDGTRETTITPSYTLLDITDPTTPKLMWEKEYTGLGMTTSVPTIIKVGGPYWDIDSNGNDVWMNGSADGQWLAVFGSGPHGDEAYNGKSDQPGRIYAIDLRTGDAYNPNPTTSGITTDYLFTTSNNAVLNSPENLDNGLTYEVNAVYFGETVFSGDDMTGKVWSFDTYDASTQTTGTEPLSWSVDDDPEDWHLHLLMEKFPSGDSIKAPITAPINLGTDNYSNIWIYFGTGKFIYDDDRSDYNQQYLFGLKDPLFNAARGYSSAEYSTSATDQAINFTTGGGLLESDNYRVYTDASVEVYDTTAGTWSDLEDGWSGLLYQVRWDPNDNDDGDDGDGDTDGVTDSQWLDGWFRLMETSGTDPSEKSLNEITILGGAVYATGYTPSNEKCSLEGTSNLYGLYYETGTAYTSPLLSTGADDDEPIATSIAIGEGKTGEPGFTPDGEELITQSSTGEIDTTDVDTAFKYKSRITNWIE